MRPRAIETLLQERAAGLLLIFNGILLVASWVMSLVAYPRLPDTVPRLIDPLGKALLWGPKSLLFFGPPALQAALFVACFRVPRWLARRASASRLKGPLLQEAVFLAYIFIQLLFIHLQRTLIYLAHGIERGFNPVYFYALFVILLALIPYFRLRMKLRG